MKQLKEDKDNQWHIFCTLENISSHQSNLQIKDLDKKKNFISTSKKNKVEDLANLNNHQTRKTEK
jgi:hypothetical protein